MSFHHLAVCLYSVGVRTAGLACALGTRLLFIHFRLEACNVNFDAPFTGNFLSEFQRESICVMQQKGRLSRQLLVSTRKIIFKNRQTCLQSVTEAFFFFCQNPQHKVFVLRYIGVGIGHDIDCRIGQSWHHQFFGSEQICMANSATDNAPQHITTILVTRENSVVNEHRCRPSVFGKHAQTKTIAIFVVTNFVMSASCRLGLFNDGKQHVCLPHRVDTLNKCKNSFEASPGINAWLWQGSARTIGGLVVLHEHKVPKLHEPVARWVVCRTTIRTKGCPTIDMNFRAWSAWTSVSCLPEIVFVTQSLNAIHGNAHLFVPHSFGFIV